jgi:hypothetical protein
MTKKTPIGIAAVVIVTVVITPLVLQYQHRSNSMPSEQIGAPPALTADVAAQAGQAARNFLEAFQNSDWETVASYWPPDAPEGKRFNDTFKSEDKALVAGLQIVSLGQPYQEKPNSWVLVPYEVRWRNGGVQTNTLRMGVDPHGRWYWEGGF